jgi:D-glycero-D-manno-heptose 1,7-bisphosphate phosphatase
VQARAIFVDRDGVIVVSGRQPAEPLPPASVDDLMIPDGVAEALGAAHDAGYVVVVVTNQPDVARGMASLEKVEAINAHIADALAIDALYTCYHDGEWCSCRKPRPGLLLQAARDRALDLERSWLIGDRWVDIAAGRAAGVKTVLLERPYSWRPTHQGDAPPGLHPDAVGADLAECVAVILTPGDGES